MKGAAIGTAVGIAAGGIRSAYRDGELTLGGAIDHIMMSFKDAFSTDSSYRKGTVTMEEFNPDGDLYYTSTSSNPVEAFSIPGGLSLKTGCANCQVPRGTQGTLFHTSYGGVQRDGIYDMAAIRIGAPLAAASCVSMPAACAGAAESMAFGTGVRWATGQTTSLNNLAVDATVGVVASPMAAAGAASGSTVGQNIWRVNNYSATLPMNLPAPAQ